jgi:ADP-ribose pyrophosphatase YjhB (NUDIX family)
MISETSAIAVVICNNKILTTHEMIYGDLKISLPKGHSENEESIIYCAIRETFEETNIIINHKQVKVFLIKELNNNLLENRVIK